MTSFVVVVGIASAFAAAGPVEGAQVQAVARCPETNLTNEQALEMAKGGQAMPGLPRLAFALGRGRLPQLQRLLDAGEDPNTCVVESSAMALAALTGDIGSMKLLKQAGAQVDAPRSATGGTALFSALSAARWSSALLLLDWGADARVVDDGESTALHELSMASPHHKAQPEPEHLQLKLAERLLAAGNPIDGRNIRGATPLLLATAKGNYPLARWLLERGADPEAPNVRGDTPAAMARRRNQSVLVDLFEDALARRRSGSAPANPSGGTR